MSRYIIKRNGNKEVFNSEKIVNAIHKACLSVGESNWKRSKIVADNVIKNIFNSKKNKDITIEEIQNIVESTLIEGGMARVAKSYILYRKHREEIRNEKNQVLNKKYIDEVDKNFDLNSLRVLASRYLKKDDNGAIVESPKKMFTRVAVHVTIPSILYDKKVYKKTENKKNTYVSEEFDIKKYCNKLSIGKYILNEFHLTAMKRVFDRLAFNGHIEIKWNRFLDMLKNGEFSKYEKEVDDYYNIMISRKFLPNTPALINFGNVIGMGSACFVLGIEDDIEDIMDKLKTAAIIFKSGGGVGYNFSHLRPEGDFVKSTGGVASGPVSFMMMYDSITDVIKQGGVRRGANMGIVNSNHPDILKFIKSKKGNKALRNFNISILLMGDFWKYYKEKKPYPLVNPKNNKVVGYVNPVQLFDMISYQAWESAEPGVLFFDNINRYNPVLDSLGPIESTNPCGEVLLYPYESCNLGSVNLQAFVNKRHGTKPKIDWEELKRVVSLASRFLDNVVDINQYPLKEIENRTLMSRKTGLGVMGLGDLLFELDVPYNSKKGLLLMEKIMESVSYYTKLVTVELAKERGAMPLFQKSFYKEGKLPFSGFYDKKSWHFDWKEMSEKMKKGVRNEYTTVIAPTGSISMIAGTSSGVEPVYSVVFEKNVSVGKFYYVDPVFEQRMREEGIMDDDLIKDVAKNDGSISNLLYVRKKIKKIFITAHDISPKDHIYALASFQKWTDSSISKTTNFSSDATVEDIKEAYILAHKLGCKGVTVYRDKSLESQVLSSGKEEDKKESGKKNETSEKDSVIQISDEKASGLSVYKDASVSPINIDISSTSKTEELNSVASDEDIAFNGVVTCKICSLE